MGRRGALVVASKNDKKEEFEDEEEEGFVEEFQVGSSERRDSIAHQQEVPKIIEPTQRLSVAAAARPRPRRPTTVFQRPKPEIPATWAGNIVDNLLTPEDQLEAAVKLADACAGGNGDSIDRLLQVVGDDEQTVFTRCTSASALAAAALTTNASMFDWNSVEADISNYTDMASTASAKRSSARVRNTLFEVVGKPVTMPSRMTMTGIQHHRRTVAGRARSTQAHQDILAALKGGVGMDALQPSTRQVTGDSSVLEAIKQAIFDSDPNIRITAVQALGHVAAKANLSTRLLLAKAARNQDSRVRVAAVTSLANLAGQARLKYESLQSEQGRWQHLIFKAKKKESKDETGEEKEEEEEEEEEDDEELFEEVLSMLVKFSGKEHDPDVRLAAALGVGEVAPRGRQDVGEALLNLLGEEDEFEHASDASSESDEDGASSDEGDHAFHTALKASHRRRVGGGLLFGKGTKDEQEKISLKQNATVPVESWTPAAHLRAAAATALGATSKLGDSKVSQALAYAVEDSDGQVRAAALGGLMAITVVGAKQPTDDMCLKVAVRAAMKHACDHEVAVRQVAVAHLGKLVPRRPSKDPSNKLGVADGKAVAILLKSLEDDEADVRRFAANSLTRVAQIGDRNVLQALLRHLKDPDWAARRAAMDSLKVLTVNKKDIELLHTLSRCT